MGKPKTEMMNTGTIESAKYARATAATSSPAASAGTRDELIDSPYPGDRDTCKRGLGGASSGSGAKLLAPNDRINPDPGLA